MRVRPRPPSGLRWRLTAWVAAVMLISAGIVFAVVYVSTGAQIRSQIDTSIASESRQLSQALDALPLRSPADVAAATRRYVRAQPYSSTSTLLYAIVPGVGVVSNHPELFGAPVPELGETVSEQQVENAASVAMRSPHPGYSTREVPDVGKMRLFERPLVLAGTGVVVGAGQPLVRVEQAQHSVATAFLLAGGVTLLLAVIASYLAGAQITAPLRRLATVAARVDAGDFGPRMEPPRGSGTELAVLAEAFNHMLDRLEAAFSGQREFVADASHELRTPLTVIRGQLEVLAAEESPSPDEVRRVERLLQAEVTRISRLVDDLLVLAQAEQRNFLRPEDIDLVPFITELWDGVSLTADRRFALGPVPEGKLYADPDRLAQAVRNLARNAIEHTRAGEGLVELRVTRLGADHLLFSVLDDGPGIPPAERERVFERFHRTDPGRSRRTGGAGLGLAIVRAITDAHGGHVRAGAREEGEGARLDLVLPGFAAA